MYTFLKIAENLTTKLALLLWSTVKMISILKTFARYSKKHHVHARGSYDVEEGQARRWFYVVNRARTETECSFVLNI